MADTALRRHIPLSIHAYDTLSHMYDGTAQYALLAYKFTGKERDSESGLDNFGKRYHASTMGRFMTPDPIGIMKQKLRDPQQWNMYSYSRNNPLRFMDPTGMYVGGVAQPLTFLTSQTVGAPSFAFFAKGGNTGRRQRVVLRYGNASRRRAWAPLTFPTEVAPPFAVAKGGLISHYFFPPAGANESANACAFGTPTPVTSSQPAVTFSQ